MNVEPKLTFESSKDMVERVNMFNQHFHIRSRFKTDLYRYEARYAPSIDDEENYEEIADLLFSSLQQNFVCIKGSSFKIRNQLRELLAYSKEHLFMVKIEQVNEISMHYSLKGKSKIGKIIVPSNNQESFDPSKSHLRDSVEGMTVENYLDRVNINKGRCLITLVVEHPDIIFTFQLMN